MSPRVVSLVPSFTETLRAWGLDPVACTQYCEQPDLPTVGGTKNPDVDAIVALAPDLVLVDVEENRRPDAEALMAAGIEVFVSEVTSLDDVGPTMQRLAQRLDLSPDRARFDVASRAELTRRAFVPIWRRPWMALGPRTYGSTVLEALGIGNVLTEVDGAYPEVDLDEIARRAPDVVLVPSEPYVFSDDHLRELESIAPVLRLDGQDLFWWGIRTPEALHRLAARLETLGPG